MLTLPYYPHLTLLPSLYLMTLHFQSVRCGLVPISLLLSAAAGDLTLHG